MDKKPAQHLVEFLLAAPILVIFFVFLTEFAFALHTNYVLTSGLKSVVSSISIKQSPKADLQASLKKYMEDNNLPYADSVSVNIIQVDSFNSAVFASYIYKPAFTMPNFFVNFMPKEMHFTTMQLTNTALIQPNNLTRSYATDGLDTMFGTGMAVANREGVMKSIKNREYLAFIVPCEAPLSSLSGVFKVVNFDGEDVFVNTVVNLGDSNLYSCTQAICTTMSQNFVEALFQLGFLNIFVVQIEPETMRPFNEKPDFWIYNASNNNDLSSISALGVLKNTLSFIPSPATVAKGTIDEISVEGYNSSVLDNNEFLTLNKDGMVIHFPSALNLTLDSTSDLKTDINIGEKVERVR